MSEITLSLIYYFWFDKAKAKFGEKLFLRELDVLVEDRDNFEDRVICAEIVYNNLEKVERGEYNV
jgi:hypothetical protein